MSKGKGGCDEPHFFTHALWAYMSRHVPTRFFRGYGFVPNQKIPLHGRKAENDFIDTTLCLASKEKVRFSRPLVRSSVRRTA